MKFFNLRRKIINSTGRAQRFRQARFQSRIRETREAHLKPRILPQAKTDISLFRTTLRKKLALVLLCLLAAGAVYWVFFTDYFLVRQAQVSGNEQVTAASISSWLEEASKERYWGLVLKTNWWFLTKDNVENFLKSKSSKILKAESHRFWPNGVKITLTERKPVAIWQTGDEYYYLSQDSVLTEQLPASYATSTQSYLKINDLSGKQVRPGDHLGVQSLLDFTLAIAADWQRYAASELSEIRVSSRASADVIALSSIGWTVYLDRNSDPGLQIRSLGLILTSEIQASRILGLAYIDMRLGNTVYYCFKNEPCAALTVPGEE